MTVDRLDPVASWLSSLGAEVSDLPGSVTARIVIDRVDSRSWRIERAALLARYVDRRCRGRALTCELTRIQAEHVSDSARATRASLASLRDTLARRPVVT